MKLEINRVDLSGQVAQATMSHKGQTLHWNLSLFEKLEKSTTRQRNERSSEVLPNFDIFEQINSYWAYLDVSVQDKIFDVYQRIRDTFWAIWNTQELTKALYPLVAELFQYHDLEEVRHWYNFKSTLTIHPNWDLKEEFPTDRDNSMMRDRTYLKEHYRQLTVLAVAIRAMIPIWGEFITRTHKEKGTALKEYYAFKLLAFSNIMHSVAMERLKLYVEASLPQDKSMESAILKAVSSEEFPIWVLSLVTVRRLAVADLRGMDPNSHLVTFIFKYIGQKVKGHDNSFMGMVKPKQVEGQAQDGENNLSKLEGIKVKQDIPAGDTEIMAFDMRNHRKIIERICPDLDPKILEMSMASVRNLESEDIQQAQTLVLKQVLAPVIPARGVDYLKKPQMVEVMGIAQAMLWQRGHRELAGLLTAIAQSNEVEMQLGVETRTRMSREMYDQLCKYWPFSRRASNKPKASRAPNVAITNIDSISQQFSKFDWKLTLPDEWVVPLTGNKNNRRYSTPHDIKIKLGALAIATATRQL